MKHVIAGTAGHIDHGKTALVRALTGTDTDRLDEEKRRGISIDIGFAHADLAPDLRVAVIDVPGHERFIKNMLAGIGGIDFVVLVIAADESIKPQTREHFEICRLLHIPTGLVAITKSDLVDKDTLGVTRLEIEDFVQGSFLQGAPIVAVSSVTGEGMDLLLEELARLARQATRRGGRAFFRLPVDRSFVMPGFGAVVTGTVFGGTVKPEDEVQLHPGGQRVRVRGVQVHGRPAKQASAGQRAALNLAGIDHSEIHRGMTVGPKEGLFPSAIFDCTFDLLPSAKRLKNHAPVHFHAGTAEAQATVRTLDNAPFVQPGSSTLVRIVLQDPLLLLPGDRFIVRQFSPVVTIGGGGIIDADPPRRMRRDALSRRAQMLAESTLEERVAYLVGEAPEGISLAALIAKIAEPLTTVPPTVMRFGDWLVDRSVLADQLASFRKRIGDFHRANPLLPGLPKEELRSRSLPQLPGAVFEAILASDKQIVLQGEFARLATHKVALQSDEQEALQRIEAAFEQAGLSVPSVPEVLQSSGVDPARARTLLQLLLRDRRLVRVSDALVFHSTAIQTLRDLLTQRKGQAFSVTEFKDWTGVTRKFAIPLLEWLDRERATRRDGDTRVIL